MYKFLPRVDKHYTQKNTCLFYTLWCWKNTRSAIELVKNNLFFFNIFIDMLNNKIQVLNTSVQDNFISNNRKRMIQVAAIHW